MIGNDIVDLAKARKDSDIWRPRYFEKVCNSEEIDYILNGSDSFKTFWRIWTMKESAYKAFQREFNFQPVFNPTAFSCQFLDSKTGSVKYLHHQVFTITYQTEDYLYSEVSGFSNQIFFGSTFDFLDQLKSEGNLKDVPELAKSEGGLPFVKNKDITFPVSKTNHGRFQVFQY